MNATHWHLVVNHLPIIFPIVGVMVMITGIISKSEAVKRTAFMIFILGALTAIVAITTGEGAQEAVKTVDEVTVNHIKIHEEIAELFAIFSYILGGISLLGLWASVKQKSFSLLLSIATLVFAFVVLFFAQWTGKKGGEIRHKIIRSGINISVTENNHAEKTKMFKNDKN